jgi:hypothetical protein
MTFSQQWLAAALAAGGLAATLFWAGAADVLGYSVLKGQFVLQTGPNTLVTDPDFAYSILAAVDLTDFDLVTNATVRPPGGTPTVMDNLADSWAFLDTRATFSALNSAYGWGNYTVTFGAVHDGNYSCVLSLPNTALPPAARLTNFAAVQAVNPLKPLTLYWSFPSAPRASDFMQVYITDGHAVVFSTPDLGEAGALNGSARTVTIPAGTLEAGVIVSLNLEITRIVSTNATAYPWAEGIAGTFRSTAIDLTTIIPPRMKIFPPTNGVVAIEVRGSPGRTNVLQSTDNLVTWRNVATNVAPLGKSVFTVPANAFPARFFRARQP